MTLDSPVWDPYDSDNGRIERECRLKLGEQPVEHYRQINHVQSNRCTELDTRLAGLTIASMQPNRQKGTVTPEELTQ
jgi:nickel-dependent lactate racemase